MNIYANVILWYVFTSIDLEIIKIFHVFLHINKPVSPVNIIVEVLGVITF